MPVNSFFASLPKVVTMQLLGIESRVILPSQNGTCATCEFCRDEDGGDGAEQHRSSHENTRTGKMRKTERAGSLFCSICFLHFKTAGPGVEEGDSVSLCMHLALGNFLSDFYMRSTVKMCIYPPLLEIYRHALEGAGREKVERRKTGRT